MNTEDVLARLKACRVRAVPLVVVNTPDQQAFVSGMCGAFNGDTPMVQWDFTRGMLPLNDLGQAAMSQTPGADETKLSPSYCLGEVAPNLPPRTVLVMHNSQRWIDELAIIQAIANLRGPFAASNRMLVLLGPFVDVPAELRSDVVVLDEPLPDIQQTTEIVEQIMEAAGIRDGRPLNCCALDAANALRGFSAFQTQQLAALSLRRDGMDLDGLWDEVRKTLRQVKGLSMLPNRQDAFIYADLGGLEAAKQHAKRVVTGPIQPTCVVWIDEVEKALAGKNDLTGVTQDQIGVLLTYLEEKRQRGMIFLGHPGTGKSALAKAIGGEHGLPVLRADLGDMLGSLVGQSQQNVREFLRVVEAVSGGKALWVATCNSIDALPAELQARFSLGTYFFDLPGEAERQAMWDIHLRDYGLRDDASLSKIDHSGWVGRDIRNCCDAAWSCGVTLEQARSMITPLWTTSRKEIEARQAAADGRYLDANMPGLYRRQITRESAIRSVQL